MGDQGRIATLQSRRNADYYSKCVVYFWGPRARVLYVTTDEGKSEREKSCSLVLVSFINQANVDLTECSSKCVIVFFYFGLAQERKLL